MFFNLSIRFYHSRVYSPYLVIIKSLFAHFSCRILKITYIDNFFWHLTHLVFRQRANFCLDVCTRVFISYLVTPEISLYETLRVISISTCLTATVLWKQTFNKLTIDMSDIWALQSVNKQNQSIYALMFHHNKQN